LAAVPSAFFAWRYRAMPQLGHFNDDGIYIVTARALAQGDSYRILSLPDEPYQIKYPPLLPLMLAGAWRLSSFPQNLPWLTLTCWLAVPVMLFLAWRWYRRIGYGPPRAAVLCSILAASPYSVLLGASAMSELWMTALVLASAALVGSKRPGWAGVAAGLAYLARTAGIGLLAIVGWYAIRRNWRAASTFAAGMLPFVVLWQIWVASHAPARLNEATMFYSSYGSFYAHNLAISDLPTVIWLNFWQFLEGIGGLVVFTLGGGTLEMILLRVIGIGCLAGLVRMGRIRGWESHHFFAGAYILMMLPWHYPPHERFVYPLLPFLLAGLSEEVLHLAGMLRKAWDTEQTGQKVVAGGLAVVLASAAGIASWRAAAAVSTYLPAMMDRHVRLGIARLRAYDWIKKNLPADAPFIASDDPSLFLYTDRKACGMHFLTRHFYRGDPKGVTGFYAGMPEFARRNGFQYLLITPTDFEIDLNPSARAEVRERIDAHPGIEIIYDSGGVSVRRMRL
jgi:hypothetical protein